MRQRLENIRCELLGNDTKYGGWTEAPLQVFFCRGEPIRVTGEEAWDERREKRKYDLPEEVYALELAMSQMSLERAWPAPGAGRFLVY